MLFEIGISNAVSIAFIENPLDAATCVTKLVSGAKKGPEDPTVPFQLAPLLSGDCVAAITEASVA